MCSLETINHQLSYISADARVDRQHLLLAMDRLKYLVSKVKIWNGSINLQNSSQYCKLLYFISHEYGKSDIHTADSLYRLNKMMHGIDLYHQIEMPATFFFGHTTGIVFVNTKYGNNLVVYQNSTIGRIGNNRPIIGDNVIIYPNSLVLGKTVISSNCVISPSTTLKNFTSRTNCLIFNKNLQIIEKPLKRKHIDEFFV